MSAPRMSVVLVTDQYRTIRRVLASLRRQTIRQDLEVVIVMPPGVAARLPKSSSRIPVWG